MSGQQKYIKHNPTVLSIILLLKVQKLVRVYRDYYRILLLNQLQDDPLPANINIQSLFRLDNL